MARQSVSKHLAVLESANLITTVRRGRQKLHYLNAEPINAIADRWIHQYDRARVQALADLKTALETESMSGSAEFVYTTYIRTTPERLWQAITDPAFSRRYMGHAMVSDFTKGSTYVWEDREPQEWAGAVMTAIPRVVDRDTFQAELDALRVREKADTHEGDAIGTLLVGRRIGRMHLVCYLRHDRRVFETYWTTIRGVEAMDNNYALMDLTVYGRQESWEESPTG